MEEGEESEDQKGSRIVRKKERTVLKKNGMANPSRFKKG